MVFGGDDAQRDRDIHMGSCEFRKVRIERDAALLQVRELQKQLTDEEASHAETMAERDRWEEILSDLAAEAGCKEEWSNLHAHGDCITNLWDAKVKAAGVVGKSLNAIAMPCGCDSNGLKCASHAEKPFQGPQILLPAGNCPCRMDGETLIACERHAIKRECCCQMFGGLKEGCSHCPVHGDGKSH